MVPAFGTIWLGRLESESGVEWRVGSAAQKAPGIKESFPGFIEPALASSIDKVPGGSRWIHEIKFDGYRVQVHVQNGQVKVFTRRGNDWTKRFRKIASDASGIDAGSAILDGEVVVPSANGVSDFSVLQNALKGRSTKIVLVAFDLPYLNGHDLRKLPLFARKAELKQIIDGTAVQFSDSFEIDGQEIARSVRTSRLGSRVSGAFDPTYLSKTRE
jgi:bifunctional non-homologous end joining protein LigD